MKRIYIFLSFLLLGAGTVFGQAKVIIKSGSGGGGGGGSWGSISGTLSAQTDLNTALGLKAPLASPTFTGTPSLPTGATAITQSAGNNSTALATTAYADAIAALKANLASPTFTGTPSLPTGTTAITQAANDNSTKIATTAYADAIAALKANLASPTFTGTPTLPTGSIAVTQSAGNSSTAIATTAFATTANNLKANIASPTFTGVVTMPTPFTLGAVSVTTTGTELNFVAGVTSAIQTQLGTKANLASPTFTGTPSLPTGTTAITQAANNNSTAIATTAYADAADNLRALIASPTFTGVPAAPTATAGTNTTQLATTAFVFAERANTVTLTNKTISGSSNTFSNIPESAVTSLTTDLSAKAPLASPTLTGTVTVPSQSAKDSSTKAANTKYVDFAVHQISGYTDSLRYGLITDTVHVGGSLVHNTASDGKDSISFDGDVVAPGNWYTYGTSGSGSKAWNNPTSTPKYESVTTTSAGTYIISANDVTVIFTGSTSTWTYPTAVSGRHLNLVNQGSGTLTIPTTRTANGTTVTTIAAGSNLQTDYDGSQWRKIN